MDGSALREWLLAGAAGLGAVVAWRGLDTWRAQLRGQRDDEVARRFLRAVLQLRETIARARVGAVTEAEWRSAAGDSSKAMDWVEGDSKAQERDVLIARHTRVGQAWAAVEAERLEAEALWGGAARACTEALEESLRALTAAVTAYIQLAGRLTGGDLEASRRLQDAMREPQKRVYYDWLDGEGGPDAFQRGLSVAVGRVEVFLRPHLTGPIARASGVWFRASASLVLAATLYGVGVWVVTDQRPMESWDVRERTVLLVTSFAAFALAACGAFARLWKD